MGLLELVTRKKKFVKEGPVKLVLDLDSVLLDTLSFRLMGKEHVIKPISTEAFLRITNLIGAIDNIKNDPKWTSEDTVDMYCSLFDEVCPTVTRDIVMDMESPQLIRLHRLVLDCISGQAYKDLPETDEKKNLEKT